MTDITTVTTTTVQPSRATGPRTAEGKALSSRNAATHGLFCRQTVLPHLGEDPRAYRGVSIRGRQ